MKTLTTTITTVAALCALASSSVSAQATLSNPAISVVLDGYYQSAERPWSEREEGFGLGHNELSMSANIDDMFFGKMTTVVEMHDGETELSLEEAFIQTLAMPAGFSIRAGRFLSAIGYLNDQHAHTDAFADRPAVYRAFLGNHFNDTGLRFDYLAPTDTYWMMGAEAFKGEGLRAEREHEEDYKDIGIYTAYTKVGGDIGINSSWQVGLSYMHNANGRLEAEDDHHEEHSHDHGHDHSHGTSFTGKHTYGLDFVYKWAPQGNYKYQNLTLSGEIFRITDFEPLDAHHDHDHDHDHEHAAELSGDHDDHAYQQGWYLSSVYQFSPSWSAGVRYGEVEGQIMHGDHFDDSHLKETEVSLAWHQSHFSTVRLQYTHQKGTNIDGLVDDNVVTLQYVMTLGAHGAHQF